MHAPLGAADRLRRPPDEVATRVREAVEASGADAETRAAMLGEEREIRESIRAAMPIEAVDEWHVGDERVALGERTIDLVPTPGHQADHLCYATAVGDERVLFSGDMAIDSFRAVLLNDRLDLERRRAVADYRRSLDRLEALSIDRIYPGHGPVHEAFAAGLERDRGSLDHRIDGVRDALAGGPLTATAVAEAAVGEHDLVYIFPEVLAALCDLVNRGVAVREAGVDGATYRLA
ncbi:putative hydrolase [Halarchaeum acidiphilum MH1-52-1]|uniref:Putative hydrolase n=1 Tax=Halarchaeum acidiphilum MH1-52-1 TaxID=1261545 RepID=U3AGG6_9EURY|nr:putative hydrolase [Halarchaeum acidiphilum MH1-52-1]